MQVRSPQLSSTAKVLNEAHFPGLEIKFDQGSDSTCLHEIDYDALEKIPDPLLIEKIQRLGEKAKLYQYQLKIFNNKCSATIDELENEFKILHEMTRNRGFWEQLNEEERVALEKYKLAIMEATQTLLLKKYKSPILESVVTPKKASKLRWVVFGAFIVLEFIPMIWGGYLGVTSLLATIPWIPEATISVAGVTICGIEAILYYAVMGPLLKEALGIPVVEQAKPRLEIYGKQLQVLKTLDLIMTVNNQMNSAEYEKYARLIALFSENHKDLKDYEIYVKDSLEDLDPSSIEGMAIVVVGSRVQIIKDKKYIINDDLELTEKERAKLSKLEHDLNGKIIRDNENNAFLDQLVDKVRSNLELGADNHSDKLRLPKFEEPTSKKALRWVLGGLNIFLNVGGGYFFAMSLLAGSAATIGLIATPLGWGIVGLVILGQLALRLAVRSNAMFNMLNPDAEKHEDVRKKINNYTPNTQEYKKILADKKRAEGFVLEHKQRAKEEFIKKSPYVDSVYTSQARLYKLQNQQVVRAERSVVQERKDDLGICK